MKPPLVSVIVPAYNAEALIIHTLNSILAQTYPYIEVLVIDDGSTDATAEIIRSVAKHDHRVILLQQPNSGVAAARNLAIARSRGEYIAPIDADDIWYPQKLEKQVQCMRQSEPSVGLVYAWSVHIDEDGLPLRGSNISDREGDCYIALLYSNFIGNASVPLIRRTCLDRVGGYDHGLREQNAQGCEDRDLYLRIAEYYHFRVVKELLVGYRKTRTSMSYNHIAMDRSHRLVLEAVKQRYPEIPPTIYRWSDSNFYWYLAWQCKSAGQHRYSVIYMQKSVILDPIRLLYLQLQKFLVGLLIHLAREMSSRAISTVKALLFKLKRVLAAQQTDLSLPQEPCQAARGRLLRATQINRRRLLFLEQWTAERERLGLCKGITVATETAPSRVA